MSKEKFQTNVVRQQLDISSGEKLSAKLQAELVRLQFDISDAEKLLNEFQAYQTRQMDILARLFKSEKELLANVLGQHSDFSDIISGTENLLQELQPYELRQLDSSDIVSGAEKSEVEPEANIMRRELDFLARLKKSKVELEGYKVRKLDNLARLNKSKEELEANVAQQLIYISKHIDSADLSKPFISLCWFLNLLRPERTGVNP
ncbi:hypothetical protein M5689_019922 [Euphorbia peplus]|nr:hypothetical protein M5689_019922 [Euphorbia peplus]